MNLRSSLRILPAVRLGLLALLLGLALLFGLPGLQAAASPTEQASPIHPTFSLLDEAGQPVSQTGLPVSTMQTCGTCHNTDFIAEHSFHASAGLESYTTPGQVAGGRPWDTSAGIFGRWDPLTYSYLTPAGEALLDLGTPDWLKSAGARHVGGGPAVFSRGGQPLTELTPDAANPETSALDPQTGQRVAWDWKESGVVEMNCFLCHTSAPNNTARQEALQAGQFGWANTATLLGSGLVTQTSSAAGLTWNAGSFTDQGELTPESLAALGLQDPSNQNCGQCHGLAHTASSDADVEANPLVISGCSATDPAAARTVLTGQVIASQRISQSGLNLTDKQDVTRSWDVHAERGLKCTDCHYSLNNPVYAQGDKQPSHLSFDPRRLELGEYLQQPLHEFARGQSAQSSIAPELQDSMRRCESCHNAASSHAWLPYTERHMAVVTCESCHVPQMYAPAAQTYDWSMPDADGNPQITCRGQADPTASVSDINTLITGYRPALLANERDAAVAPYNLVTTWYWVYGDPARPAPLDLVVAAAASAKTAANPAQSADAMQAALTAAGLANPRLVGEVQPYSINHNVTSGEWATRDCRACHGSDSVIAQPVQLAAALPAAAANLSPDEALSRITLRSTAADGELYMATDQTSSALFFRPTNEQSKLYLLGRDSVTWIDWLGGLMFLGVLAGVSLHGGLRFLAARKQAKSHTAPALKQVYMYAVYERLWHWLQTFTILLLLFTGLIIHKPDTFGIFSFSYVVLIHNALAAVLVLNAALSLFYHLVSGEIKQYIPRPYGFFDQAIVQAKYYLEGIFKRAPHPFEKTPQKKLNPLQQVTYFGILNVLLPLQIITGIFMWGASRWPDLTASLGGLPLLAPFHTLVAWTFATFIVAHVYLTTTGHEPLAGIRSMMYGWDEVETHDAGHAEPPAASAPQPSQD